MVEGWAAPAWGKEPPRGTVRTQEVGGSLHQGVDRSISDACVTAAAVASAFVLALSSNP